MRFQSNSSKGRSLIEILAVLAVSAVLTLASLAGLRTLFLKHQSNELIEDVKTAGFIVVDELWDRLSFDNTLSLENQFIAATSFPFTAFKESETTFAVLVSDIPYSLCIAVQKRKPDWLEEIIINTEQNSCQETPNTLAFYFNTELNSTLTALNEVCREDADCGECGKCLNRSCSFENGEVKTGNSCVPCDSSSVSIRDATKASCQQCTNRFYDGTEETGGTCSLCSLSGIAYHTNLSECQRCPNRYLGPSNNTVNGEPNGFCYTCQGTSIGTGCIWNCPTGQFGAHLQCHDCTSTENNANSPSTIASCRQCPNRFYDGASSYNGNCYLCSQSATTFSTRQSDCLKCPQRAFDFSERFSEDGERLGLCTYCENGVSEDKSQCIE